MMSRVLKRLACQSALVCLLMAACTGAVITGDQFADEDVIASPEVDVHEETTTPDPTLTITTEVDPTEIEAGESVTVTCSAVDENGEPVDIEFAVLVTPDEGVTGDDFELTLTVAGSYEVACRVAPDGQVDDNPVTLTVNPGPAARVETSLDPPEVAASEESDVTCRMVDEYGNEVSNGGAWILEHPEEVNARGLRVSSEIAGEYDVRCLPQDGLPEGIESDPAVLTVVPGPAQGIRLIVTPDRPWYNLGASMTFSYEVIDAYGNVIEDADWGPLSISVTPDEGLGETGNDLQYRCDELGMYDVLGSVPGPPEASDSLVIACDPDPPVIELFEPARGLTLDGAPEVTVRGNAFDEVSGLDRVTLNGEPLEVDQDGNFETTMPLGQGMNVVWVQAYDKVGHEAETLRAVYYSTHWYTMDPDQPELAFIPKSIEAFISSLFFYNQDDPDAMTLSSLVGTLLESLDFTGVVPSPLTDVDIPLCNQPTYVDFSDIRFTVAKQIDLGTEANPRLVSHPIFRPRDGGLRIFAQFTDFSGHLDIDSPGSGLGCINASGRLYMNVEFQADFFITLDEDGQIEIRVANVNIRIWDLDSEVSGIVGFISRVGREWLRKIMADLVRELIVDTLADLLAEVGELLNVDEEIVLDPFIGEGESLPLRLQLAFSRLDFSSTEPPPAGVRFAAALAATAPHRVEHEILGSIGRASCLQQPPEEFALEEEKLLEAAVFDDALNAALYALWSGGMLNLTITNEDLGDTDLTQYGISDLEVDTAPLLPPIITSCNDQEMFVAQVGDFWIRTQFNLLGQPVDMVFYLYADIEILLLAHEGAEGQEIGVDLGEFRIFQADIVSLNEDQHRNRARLEALIEETVPMVLLTEVFDEPITFEIPELDLEALDDSGMLPPGIVINLVIDEFGRRMGRTLATISLGE